jgi:hypothetical protein
MERLLRNVRYAVRVLARTPGFTITVVLTLVTAVAAIAALLPAIRAGVSIPCRFCARSDQ